METQQGTLANDKTLPGAAVIHFFGGDLET